MEKVKIGMLGLGNVGTGVWEIMQSNYDKMKDYVGRDFEITRILVRNPEKARNGLLTKDTLTTRVEDILEDAEIKLIIEVMGGLQPAYAYIKQALSSGKHVVTANKALISVHGKELIELAQEKGVNLLFEASVGGGIPIIASLSHSLAANEIDEIVGILNGTTNYILTQMTKQGMNFDDALKQAQEKGYAEADPTSDVEGEDAAFKLSILTSIAFDTRVVSQDIPREGITKVSKIDIAYAAQLGYTIKLLAAAKRRDGNLELHVHPTLIPSQHPLAAVDNEFNALFVKGNAVGDLMLYGKGAGSLPTGSAVMGDVLRVVKHIHIENGFKQKQAKTVQPLQVIGEGIGEYYVRLMVTDKPGVLGKIASTFGSYGISLASVVQTDQGQDVIPLVFITHQVERKELDRALEVINNFGEVAGISSILKVESLK
ncbi:MAG: homoserine dehydrogenase [Bacillota bacterium]